MWRRSKKTTIQKNEPFLHTARVSQKGRQRFGLASDLGMAFFRPSAVVLKRQKKLIMLRRNRSTFALLGMAFALGACTPPKTDVAAPAPVVKKEEPKVPEPPLEPMPSVMPSDEIPMPDMLTMPTDRDFRATNPILPKTGPEGVIIRPPTDPPSRVKPKPAEGEN